MQATEPEQINNTGKVIFNYVKENIKVFDLFTQSEFPPHYKQLIENAKDIAVDCFIEEYKKDCKKRHHFFFKSPFQISDMNKKVHDTAKKLSFDDILNHATIDGKNRTSNVINGMRWATSN